MKFGHRRSIRLKGYDYSMGGYYFVTICTQDRQYLFKTDTELNEIGKTMDYWWNELPNHFENIINLDEYVIMPNHLYGIIVIKNEGEKGGHAGPPVQKDMVGAGLVPVLGEIIGAFKSITTNEYIKKIKSDNWPKFDKRIWQRNYYERIIRNEKEYLKIKNYIKMNLPAGRQARKCGKETGIIYNF